MFVATRHHVEYFGALFRATSDIGKGGVYMVYGNMDQVARNDAVSGFYKNRGVLITTDVAARGIDIPLLDSVINYDFPPSPKLFVHRSGRTARAGHQGLCSSILVRDDIPYMMDLMLFLGKKLETPLSMWQKKNKALEDKEADEDGADGDKKDDERDAEA